MRNSGVTRPKTCSARLLLCTVTVVMGSMRCTAPML
jgi:hypothetical protein